MGADGLEPALARYERVVLTFELHPRKLQEAGLEPASRRATDFK